MTPFCQMCNPTAMVPRFGTHRKTRSRKECNAAHHISATRQGIADLYYRDSEGLVTVSFGLRVLRPSCLWCYCERFLGKHEWKKSGMSDYVTTLMASRIALFLIAFTDNFRQCRFAGYT